MKTALMLVTCLAPLALAQDKSLDCNEDGGHWRDRGHYCEMREATVPASAQLEVDGGINGGIAIKGADRSDILVRSRVEANEDDQADSRRMVSQVRVETDGGRIHASGPTSEHHGWSVSYEVFVPRRIDLVLRTHNGGITIRPHTVRGDQRRGDS
jgi:hypothetical protein